MPLPAAEAELLYDGTDTPPFAGLVRQTWDNDSRVEWSQALRASHPCVEVTYLLGYLLIECPKGPCHTGILNERAMRHKHPGVLACIATPCSSKATDETAVSAWPCPGRVIAALAITEIPVHGTLRFGWSPCIVITLASSQ